MKSKGTFWRRLTSPVPIPSFAKGFGEGVIGSPGGFATPRPQGTRKGQGAFESGIVPVQGFIQVDFHNSIVVEAHGFT